MQVAPRFKPPDFDMGTTYGSRYLVHGLVLFYVEKIA